MSFDDFKKKLNKLPSPSLEEEGELGTREEIDDFTWEAAQEHMDGNPLSLLIRHKGENHHHSTLIAITEEAILDTIKKSKAYGLEDEGLTQFGSAVIMMLMHKLAPHLKDVYLRYLESPPKKDTALEA